MHYQSHGDNVHNLGCSILTKAIFCANNLKWPCGRIAEFIICHQTLLLYSWVPLSLVLASLQVLRYGTEWGFPMFSYIMHYVVFDDLEMLLPACQVSLSKSALQCYDVPQKITICHCNGNRQKAEVWLLVQMAAELNQRESSVPCVFHEILGAKQLCWIVHTLKEHVYGRNCDDVTVVIYRITLTTWSHGLEAFSFVSPGIGGWCNHSLKLFLLLTSKTIGYWDLTESFVRTDFSYILYRGDVMKVIGEISNLVPFITVTLHVSLFFAFI